MIGEARTFRVTLALRHRFCQSGIGHAQQGLHAVKWKLMALSFTNAKMIVCARRWTGVGALVCVFRFHAAARDDLIRAFLVDVAIQP